MDTSEVEEVTKVTTQIYKDPNSLATELLLIKQQAIQDISNEDYHHLQKIIWLNRVLLIIGLGGAWIAINPISILCISLSLTSQWVIVAHHVCHGGYDRAGMKRYHSKRFALGWRRFIDWSDWIYPPAWSYEHNVLHHFYTNERLDPDVLSYNMRGQNKPLWLRVVILVLTMCTWKASYYSLNTLKALNEKKNYCHDTAITRYFLKTLYLNYLPYVSIHFILLPLLFFPLGSTAVMYVLINRLIAEVITNIHTFLVVTPNHSGDDIPLQTEHFESKEGFYKNQILSSCNYHTGGFWRDYLQGYLNYQIEHHLFPDLPLLQYVKIQPRVKAVCNKYKIPYTQQSIFLRIKKMIAVGLCLTKKDY